jgi:hypothetical protein
VAILTVIEIRSLNLSFINDNGQDTLTWTGVAGRGASEVGYYESAGTKDFTAITPILPTFYFQNVFAQPAQWNGRWNGLDAIGGFAVVDPVTSTPGDPPYPIAYPFPFSSGLIYGRDNLSVNLTVFRGDTYSFNITVQNNSAPVDLTGAVLIMTAKYRYQDVDANAVFQLKSSGTYDTTKGSITVTTPLAGQASVILLPPATLPLAPHLVNLVYDIQMVQGGNTYTIVAGTLSIRPDATITTS